MRSAGVFLAAWGAAPLGGAWEFLRASGSSRLIVLAVAALVIVTVMAAVHEPVHAAAYRLLARKPRTDVRIGFDRKKLLLYTHYRCPVPARLYRLVTAMPGLVLGVLPWAFAVATGSVVALLIGVVGLVSASGDLVIVWRLRGVASTALVADHPSRPGGTVIG